MTDTHPPLIVTLEIDPAAGEFFNALRKKHFPAHINYLDAHFTLFHNLPSDERDITENIRAAAQRPQFLMDVTGVKHIGNGVVYTIESAAARSLHAGLQKKFDSWLIRKDRQKLWPHITIQNKVTNYKSLMLRETLAKDFTVFTIGAVGLKTWLYLKGPWEPVEFFPFLEQ